MPTVRNPPALVAQQTVNWCFAAVQVMVCRFYGRPAPSQYDIARQATYAGAQAELTLQMAWAMAESSDGATDQAENGGANLQSAIVGLVRGRWGAFDHEATEGRFSDRNLAADTVRQEIDANRIFVVGTGQHYYVVYGYEDGGSRLRVLDPWPAGVGGHASELTLSDLNTQPGRVVIVFDRAPRSS